MITRPTVFVLGAGASSPYGFPIGAKLLEILRQRLVGTDVGSQQFRSRLSKYVNEPLFQLFVRDSEAGRRESPDAVVESRPDFLELVKPAIALILSEFEREDALYRVSADQDWYRYLLRHIIPATAGQFTANELRVVTFNFDRSFEYSLFRALQATFNLDDGQAAGLASSIPIAHIHGQLGFPSWSGVGDPRIPTKRAYEPTITDEQLAQCVSQIRLVHEEVEGSEELNRAREWLAEAELIAFLGFGFHRLNLARLRVRTIQASQIVRATAYGFTRAELQPISRAFPNTRLLVRPGFSCVELLRHTDILHWEKPR